MIFFADKAINLSWTVFVVNPLVNVLQKGNNERTNRGKRYYFVAEAAPPALMRALAIELIKRKLTVSG